MNPVPSVRLLSVAARGLIACAALALLPACASRPVDPVAALSSSSEVPERQLQAIKMLREQQPLSEGAKVALRRVLFAPGFNLQTRQAAFDLLMEADRDGMREALQANIVRLESFEFRRWMLEQIGARGMKDYTVVVVNSWAGPVPSWGPDERKRPEYEAMAALYGEDKVADALFQVLLDAHPVRQSALRARTWELLMRIGQRDRLKELVLASASRPDDVMLRDIRKLVDEFGILPETREELLWLAKLRQTASPAFWAAASAALKQVPEDQKRNFELRGIPVVVAAAAYDPQALSRTRDELLAEQIAALKNRDAGKYSANFTGWEQGRTESLAMQKEQAKWIDLLAVRMALKMLEDPKVRAKLFDIADRDLQDRRTEYGGIVRIKDDGTWEIVEVRPRATGVDTRFEAPQELFDMGYTALFHFHMHCQEYENGNYAGPHMGDFGYADSTRANCLVFSFVRRNELNADYYRHGKFVVDMGKVSRPD
ncbi:MAG: hypothetical protein U0625_08005 [Phycisphaerales bacterium]